MKLQIDILGDVVEWQELLDGTQIVTVEGASADGWTLSGGLTWNIKAKSSASEGDITLTRADGAELFGTLAVGDVTELGGDDVEEADHAFRLRYEIDGGTAAFESARGEAAAEGKLSRAGFRGRWLVSLGPG